MPQIQMLEPQAGFGSQLGQMLGSGVGQGLSQGISAYFQNKQRKSALEGLTPIFEEMGLQPQQIQTLVQSGLGIPESIEALKTLSAFRSKKKEESLSKENIEGAFHRLWDLSDEIGWSPLPAGASLNAEKRSEFESNKGALVGALREMVNRGALTNQKFQYITEKLLPSHSDRTVTKRGKLKGIARTLGIELPSEKNEPEDISKEFVIMETPDGKRRKIPKDQARKAQQAGAKLIK